MGRIEETPLERTILNFVTSLQIDINYPSFVSEIFRNPEEFHLNPELVEELLDEIFQNEKITTNNIENIKTQLENLHLHILYTRFSEDNYIRALLFFTTSNANNMPLFFTDLNKYLDTEYRSQLGITNTVIQQITEEEFMEIDTQIFLKREGEGLLRVATPEELIQR